MIVKKKLILKSEDGELKAEMKVKCVGCAKELRAGWVGGALMQLLQIMC